MKVKPIVDNDFNEQVLTSLPDEDSTVDCSGWVTEKGNIFYCETTPKFDPETGEKLEIVKKF